MDINNTLNSTQVSTEMPKMIAKRTGRSTMYYIPYNIVEDNGAYNFKYVLLSPSDYNYGGLVDAIIGVKYSLRDFLAVIANYASDPKNSKYESEFLELQEWRKFAKDESRKHFNL